MVGKNQIAVQNLLYYLYLVPIDFWRFPKLKIMIEEKRFDSIEDKMEHNWTLDVVDERAHLHTFPIVVGKVE